MGDVGLQEAISRFRQANARRAVRLGFLSKTPRRRSSGEALMDGKSGGPRERNLTLPYRRDQDYQADPRQHERKSSGLGNGCRGVRVLERQVIARYGDGAGDRHGVDERALKVGEGTSRREKKGVTRKRNVARASHPDCGTVNVQLVVRR